MQPQPIDSRVERLERRVTALEEMPARLDALTLQVSQLREEMHGEFSAIRREFREGLAEGLGGLHKGIRAEIREGDEETRRTLREEIRASDEEILNQARVLHEDVISRLSLIQEGRSPRRKQP